MRLPAAALAAYLSAAAPAAAAVAPYVPATQIGDVVADATMLDQDGGTVRWSDWRGKTLVVGFIYTRCPEPKECPLTTARFATMQRLLAGTPVHLVEVTLDPAYDAPAVLRRYAAPFGADPQRWTLVTGDPATMSVVARRYGIVTEGTPGKRGFVHAEGVVIVDRDGRLTDRIDGNDWTAQEVAAQARARAALPSNPLARAWLTLKQGVSAACGGTVSGIPGWLAALVLASLLAAGALVGRRLYRSLLAGR